MQWHERIGQRLRLRDLHILLAVVEAGSMVKAATHLGISQPAVSKAIADMEHTIGLRLVDRTRKGLAATMYGRALVQRAAVIFDELKRGVQEIQFLADPTAGELCIGSSEAIAAGLLPAIIDRLSQRYPKIVFHVAQIGSAPPDFRHLRERSVELVLGRIPTSLPRGTWRSSYFSTSGSPWSPEPATGGCAVAGSISPNSWVSPGLCRHPTAYRDGSSRMRSAQAASICRMRPSTQPRSICSAIACRRQDGF
jgi:DNA-binding transcriptional LysR family regulator